MEDIMCQECTKNHIYSANVTSKESNIYDIVDHDTIFKNDDRINSMGCNSACPKCLRTCILNTGHYGPCECSEGHTW